MKYNVTRACGHTEEVELFGKSSDRESKIKWLESTACSECYHDEQHEDCDKITMSYKEYKESYSVCETLPKSYDPKAKTIVVYVPRQVEKIAEAVAKKQLEEELKAAGANQKLIDRIMANPDQYIEDHKNTFAAATPEQIEKFKVGIALADKLVEIINRSKK